MNKDKTTIIGKDEETFELDYNSGIYVYGYGVKGQHVISELIKQGFNVECIIDKQGDEIKSNSHIPIMKLEQACISQSIEDDIVMVCLWNAINHENVAEKLYDAGFRKIIYFPIGHDSVYSERMRNAFTCLSAYEFSNIKNVPFYQRPSAAEGKIILETEKHISLWCDVDKLLCIKRCKDQYTCMNEDSNIWTKYEDKPIKKLQMYLDLFEYLGGNKDVNIDEYLEYSRPGDLAEKEKLIEVKRRTFDIYEYNRKYDPGFFVQSPIECIYAGRGCLYVEDGYHRATYLISCGYEMVPVIVTKEDYKKFMEDDK